MPVLIVDDEPDICGRISKVLRYENIESVEAHNGLSAKRLLEQAIFSAVVTDLKMPGMDGLQLLSNNSIVKLIGIINTSHIAAVAQ